MKHQVPSFKSTLFYMEKRFQDQVAIVTGGADGIGKEITQRLLTEGATVVIFDRNTALAEETCQAFAGEGLNNVSAVSVDVADDADVSGAISKVVETHGKLDVVVHCAGIVGPNATKMVDVDVADFDKVYEINLRGSFLITKYALKVMEPNNYGRILLFASIAGKEGNAGMAAYSATKAGVIGLVKTAGKEFAETGITVNAIAPAVIRTAMVEALDPWQITYMTDKIPMKRCGTLEEVAALSCWIVSKEASFNTGYTFDLTGGRATY